MRAMKRKITALLMALVMTISMMTNVTGSVIAAENSMQLPNTSVTVVTFVNGVETAITNETILNNGDKVQVNLAWKLSNLATDQIDAGTDLYYDLGVTGVTISNKSGQVIQNNVAVGNYNIDDKGVLHIFITDDTLLSQSDISGGLTVDAIISVNDLQEDEKGQVQAQIAGTTITVQKTDPNSIPSVSKSRTGGVYTKDGKNYQDFTVIVRENGTSDSITFTDVFGNDLTYVAGSLKLDGTAVTPTVNGQEMSYTINDAVKGTDYTFTYSVEIADSAFSDDYYYSSSNSDLYNTAKVENSNNSMNSSNTFSLGSKTWASKWGWHDSSNGLVYWTVVVNDGDSIDMSGTTIKDTLPENTTVSGDVTITPASGAAYTITGDQLTAGYTFPTGSVGKYTITYATTANGSSNGITSVEYKNNINVTNPDYGVNKNVTGTVTVHNDWITKKYDSVDVDAQTITWKSEINIPSTQTEAIALSFKDVLGTGLTYKPGTFKVDYGTTSVTNPYTGDVSGTSFNVALGSVKYVEGTDNKITITYTTSYDAGEAEEYSFTNTSYVVDPNGNEESAESTYRYTKSELNIVQYKSADGQNGTKGSWYLQVVNTSQLYDEALAGEKIYLYDTPTLKDADGNVISTAEFEVVNGSITVGGVATDLITVSSDDNKTFRFDITNYILANQYTGYFELRYTYDLTDETIRSLLASGSNVTYMYNQVDGILDDGNTEEKLGSVVGNGYTTSTVGTLLTKNYNYTSTTAPYAEYTINVNPEGYDLIDGEGTLTLKDVMGSSLDIDLSTVSLVTADGRTLAGITTSFDSATRTLLIENIPDGTPCILSYSVFVNVNYKDGETFESQAGNIDVSNACSLYTSQNTLSSSNVKLTGTVQKSSAWATSDYGSIIVSKHSGLTVLGGAVFTVTAYKMSDDGSTMVVNTNYAEEYKNKGVTIGSVETGADGKKTVNLVFDVLYKIEETKAPAGYVSTGKPIYVIIPGDDYSTIESAVDGFIAAEGATLNQLKSGSTLYVENQEMGYGVSVAKVDQYGDAVVGATFELQQQNAAGEFVKVDGFETTTDSYGKLSFVNLPQGIYRVVETKAPDGYDQTKLYVSDSFILNETNKTVTITATNTKLTGKLEITKVDEDGNKLSGVTFVLKKDGVEVETAITDANGVASFDELELGAEYVYQETATLSGYILDDTECKVTVTDSDVNLTKKVQVKNYKESGSIKITKTSTADPTVFVEGATYTLYDSKQNVVLDENGKPVIAVTDANGVARFTGLKFGLYYVRETEAPENYMLDPQMLVANVNSNTKPVELKHYNDEKKLQSPYMSFKFKKVGIDVDGNSQAALSGAVFELYRVDTVDGTPEYNKVDTAISGEDGYVYFMNVTRGVANGSDVDYYTYVVKELEPAPGYVLTGETVCQFIPDDSMDTYAHVGILTTGQKDLVVALKDITEPTNDLTVTNYEAEGQVILTKKSETGELLQGAVYAAYKDGSDSPSAKSTTDADGVITFTGMTYGSVYVIKELQAPEGYALSDEEFSVIIGSNSSSQYIEYKGLAKGAGGVNNIYTYAIDATDTPLSLKVSKQSIVSSDEVAGATITLTDSNGTVVDKWVSGDSAHSIDSTKLKTNVVYTLTETAAPAGYSYSEEIYFMIEADGTVKLMTGSDENATLSGTTIVMKDKGIELSIAKVDATTQKNIVGAVLCIKDDDGNELTTWSSTTSDYVITTEIASKIGLSVPANEGDYNKYTLVEVSAPEDYYMADDIDFYVGHDGNVYLVDANGAYVKAEDGRVVMSDVPYGDDVTISKKAIAGGPELPGASLTLIDLTADVEIYSWESTTVPYVIPIETLVLGNKYQLVETGAPQGYSYTESITFELDADGKVVIDGETVDGNYITMIDDAVNVSINKVDIHGEPVVGAELVIYDEQENQICEFESGDESFDVGQYLQTPNPSVSGELNKYRLTEQNAPVGYKVSEDIYFAIDSYGLLYISSDGGLTYSQSNSSAVTMVDEPMSIYVNKVDATDSKGLSGAKLTITEKESGKEIITWISTGTKKELPLSLFKPSVMYTLTELESPYGYEIANSINFIMDSDGTLYAGKGLFNLHSDTIVMKDELDYMYINRIDRETSDNVAGSELKVVDPSGTTVGTWVTTTDKYEVPIKEFKPDTEYTVIEEVTADGYTTAESKVFKVTEDGKVHIKTEDGFTEVTDKWVVITDKPGSTSQDKPNDSSTEITTEETTSTTTEETTSTTTEATTSTTENTTEDTPTDTTVATGDNSNISMVFMVMLISGVGLMLLGLRKRSKA
ncbi:MAG: hypothetical protein IJX85_11685 [Lachnospiraceae bacterium]|nr:hypothetical protein [Lachnospiraceae bacterium]